MHEKKFNTLSHQETANDYYIRMPFYPQIATTEKKATDVGEYVKEKGTLFFAVGNINFYSC